MSQIAQTRQNDTVDLIVHRHYGIHAGAVEAVLDANPHLGAQGAVLPVGLDIVLPDLSPPVQPRLTLWNAP